MFRSSRQNVVLRKRCSENMQQIYRRTPMSKCDLNSNFWNFHKWLVNQNGRDCFWSDGVFTLLRTMCKLSEIDEQKYLKNVIFSKSSTHFTMKFAQGNSYQFCWDLFLDLRILCFFPLSYSGNNFPENFQSHYGNKFCSVNLNAVYIFKLFMA